MTSALLEGACSVLALVVMTLAIVVAWLVHRNGSLTDQLLAARDNAGKNALDAERAKYDDAADKQALAGEKQREQNLEQLVTHDEAPSPDPGAGLPADDVADRVRRIAGQAGVPGDAGGGGAKPAAAVPGPAAAGATGADVQHGE